MTSERLKALELERIVKRIESGAIPLLEGLSRAMALGAEFERLEVMHSACEGYSRARFNREQALRGDSWPPPKDE